MRKFLRIWFPLIFYSGIIFWLSSIPNLKFQDSKLPLDKVAHLLEYMPFGYLLGRVIHDRAPALSWQKIWLGVILGAFLYALSDEFHQMFVAGRSSDILDAVADTTGAAIAGWIFAQKIGVSKN